MVDAVPTKAGGGGREPLLLCGLAPLEAVEMDVDADIMASDTKAPFTCISASVKAPRLFTPRGDGTAQNR